MQKETVNNNKFLSQGLNWPDLACEPNSKTMLQVKSIFLLTSVYYFASKLKLTNIFSYYRNFAKNL